MHTTQNTFKVIKTKYVNVNYCIHLNASVMLITFSLFIAHFAANTFS